MGKFKAVGSDETIIADNPLLIAETGLISINRFYFPNSIIAEPPIHPNNYTACFVAHMTFRHNLSIYS